MLSLQLDGVDLMFRGVSTVSAGHKQRCKVCKVIQFWAKCHHRCCAMGYGDARDAHGAWATSGVGLKYGYFSDCSKNGEPFTSTLK